MQGGVVGDIVKETLTHGSKYHGGYPYRRSNIGVTSGVTWFCDLGQFEPGVGGYGGSQSAETTGLGETTRA